MWREEYIWWVSVELIDMVCMICLVMYGSGQVLVILLCYLMDILQCGDCFVLYVGDFGRVIRVLLFWYSWVNMWGVIDYFLLVFVVLINGNNGIGKNGVFWYIYKQSVCNKYWVLKGRKQDDGDFLVV